MKNNIMKFNEFLFEKEIHIGMASGLQEFLQGTLVNAKKAKLLKRVKGYNDNDMGKWHGYELPMWVRDADWNHLTVPTGTKTYGSHVSRGHEALEVDKHHKGYLPAYVMQLNDNQVVEMTSLAKDPAIKHKIEENDYIRILVTSGEPLDIKEIENILPDTVVSSYKNTVYTGTRSTIKDSSKILAKVGNIVKQRYYIVFEYKLAISSGETVTAEQVVNSASLKQLLKELPLEVTSTPKQLKNGTIVLAVPSEYVLDPEDDKITGSKYLHTYYGLYSAGYIRRLSELGDQPQMIGKFNASTLKGWEEGLEKVRDLFMKTFKKIEKSGGKVFYTDEERHNKRGVIAGRKFGIN